jgi:hypothetical protein
MNLFILDKEIFFGHFLSFDYSSNTPFYKIPNDSSLTAQSINKHFKTIKDRSILLTEELLETILTFR